MRRYDEVLQVQRGQVDGIEAPTHFLWRDRLWRVTAVAAQWVETGSWWDHRQLQALLGVEQPGVGEGSEVRTDAGDGVSLAEVVGERRVWRVEATRGREGPGGVFDLALDAADGRWRLLACLD
jgi:hypothetical protein